MKTKQRKGGSGAKAGNWHLSLEPETFVALERLQRAWGSTLGHAVTCVLDLCTVHALADAEQLQGLVSKLHPAYSGRPLLEVPPNVFLDAINAQDRLHGRTEGRA